MARLKPVDAATAARLREDGALMVDIREPGEYTQIRIPGSANAALSAFAGTALPAAAGQPVVFLCASGNRTSVHAAELAAKAGAAETFVLAGGIAAWMAAGLPIESGRPGEVAAPRRGWSTRFRS
jgi:rhodanese-related sulfurtransferase